MITISGHSDDVVEVEGCDSADEFLTDGDGRWHADLIAPDGEKMRVFAEWDATRNGCWAIGVQQVYQGVPMPDWVTTINATGSSAYSATVRVHAPEGTRLDNVWPARDDDDA